MMRETDGKSGSLISYVDLEDRIPVNHPLRQEVAAEIWTAGMGGFSEQWRHDAASKEQTMARRPRRNHSPAFKV